MTRSSEESLEWNELVGRLLNEDLDAVGWMELSARLSGDIELQRRYVQQLDLEASLRSQAESLDDEDFALLEVQAALDAVPRLCSDEMSDGDYQSSSDGNNPEVVSAATRLPLNRQLANFCGWPLRHTGRAAVAVAVLISIVAAVIFEKNRRSEEMSDLVASTAPEAAVERNPAQLSGAVGARWAGAQLELPEGQQFEKGQRLELVEGLAEIGFGCGARVVVQGPAILQIHDETRMLLVVGRMAATVPLHTSRFTIRTAVANLTSVETEFGAEVEVDGSLKTQVYHGDVEMRFSGSESPTKNLHLNAGQGLQVERLSGRIRSLDQPNGLQFVRYLPQHETQVNLADVVAGGNGCANGTRKAYHRGINLVDGRPVDDYGAPAQSDGSYCKVDGVEFVDGVFVPDGQNGPTQVDSIGRLFAGFPATAGDCWGGAIMARRPNEEESLPFIRLEYYGDIYGYVNWLHIASKPEELSPQGYGLIGMHSNCGITFDLHAIRARHQNKRVTRFRAVVGNLESKPEAYSADAWIIVDGRLRYHRKGFSREDGPEVIDLQLTDRDRFLVLVVTDAGGDTAYDWVAFGDPIIELESSQGRISNGAFSRPASRIADNADAARSLSRRDGVNARDPMMGAFAVSATADSRGVDRLDRSKLVGSTTVNGRLSSVAEAVRSLP